DDAQLLAQNLQTPYTRVDAAMGFAQAVGTGALVWGATLGRRRRTAWIALTWAALAVLAVGRVLYPVAAGLGGGSRNGGWSGHTRGWRTKPLPHRTSTPCLSRCSG
ncbi:MAG: hypothetical protein AAB922_00190, partial [Patescibacteria group bacterium]